MITRYMHEPEKLIEITQASSFVKIPRSLPCDKISIIRSSTKGETEVSRIVHLSVYAVVLPFRNLGTLRMPKAVGDHIWVRV